MINQRQFRAGLVQGVDADRPPMFPAVGCSPRPRDRMRRRSATSTSNCVTVSVKRTFHLGLDPRAQGVCVGDFVIWAFPNAGNPKRLQRYPLG